MHIHLKSGLHEKCYVNNNIAGRNYEGSSEMTHRKHYLRAH